MVNSQSIYILININGIWFIYISNQINRHNLRINIFFN